jgi:hypothetical protein
LDNQPHQGHTTTEYAICIGLLCLLAVGGLKLLGTNISALLYMPVSASTNQQSSRLYSLIGSQAGGGVSGINLKAAAAPVSQVVDIKSLQLQINPATGQIVTSDTTGGGKNTTSVAGDQAMRLLAQQLGQIAKSTLPNGQPMPDQVQALLMKLMQDGTNLADNYGETLALRPQFDAINAANAGKTKELQMYPGDMMQALGDSLEKSLQFQQDYEALSTVLNDMAKSNPTLNETLIKPIDQVAGSISSMQYENVGKAFVENMNPQAILTSDLLEIYQQSPSIQNAVPPAEMMNAMGLPEDKAASAIQQLIADAAQNAVVGTRPTCEPVTIAVTPASTPSQLSRRERKSNRTPQTTTPPHVKRTQRSKNIN